MADKQGQEAQWFNFFKIILAECGAYLVRVARKHQIRRARAMYLLGSLCLLVCLCLFFCLFSVVRTFSAQIYSGRLSSVVRAREREKRKESTCVFSLCLGVWAPLVSRYVAGMQNALRTLDLLRAKFL